MAFLVPRRRFPSYGPFRQDLIPFGVRRKVCLFLGNRRPDWQRRRSLVTLARALDI